MSSLLLLLLLVQVDIDRKWYALPRARCPVHPLQYNQDSRQPVSLPRWRPRTLIAVKTNTMNENIKRWV